MTDEKENVIDKIDNGLRQYYKMLKQSDYDDADGKGKFLNFCEV